MAVKVRVADVDNLSNSELAYLIDEWCHNQKYREILKLRFIDGMTFEALAEEVDMSVRQVQNIVYKEGDKVLSHVSFNNLTKGE